MKWFVDFSNGSIKKSGSQQAQNVVATAPTLIEQRSPLRDMYC